MRVRARSCLRETLSWLPLAFFALLSVHVAQARFANQNTMPDSHMLPDKKKSPEKEECGFLPRKIISPYISELSPALLGFVSCAESHPELSVFYTVRFAHPLPLASLEEFVRLHANKLIVDGIDFIRPKSTIFNERLTPGHRQFLFKTSRTAGHEPTTHFVFEAQSADGATVLFIHSMGERDFLLHRLALENAKRELASAEFLKKMN